jgi:hypothetical protein
LVERQKADGFVSQSEFLTETRNRTGKKGFPSLETWSLRPESGDEPIIDPVQKNGDCKNEPNQEAMEMANNEP